MRSTSFCGIIMISNNTSPTEAGKEFIMAYEYRHYQESAEVIKSRLNGFVPEILIILGSGLGFMADEVEEPIYIPYSEIPHFRVSTAPDHVGRFVCGKLCDRKVAMMQGRLHCYEGYSMEDAAYPVRVMKLIGADKVVVTNAAGCVNTEWEIGDIMLIKDHIRLFGFGPLNGANIPEFGPRFNDMRDVYSAEYRAMAKEEAAKLNMTLREGVYMYFPGPSYETPAEVRAARILGADAVGMSTVPEMTVAAHADMKSIGLALMTNMAAGVTDNKLSGEEVSRIAALSAERFSRLLRAVLARM